MIEADRPPIVLYRDVDHDQIPDGWVFVFMPSLIAVCLHHERALGRVLRADEFAELRDACKGAVGPIKAAEAVEKAREYTDISEYEDYLHDRVSHPATDKTQ